MNTVPHGGVRRKGRTTRSLAQEIGKSERWVAGITAEPREQYLGRAQERAQRAVELRKDGLTLRAIADELDVSLGSVHRYIKQAREEGKLS